MKNNMGKPEEKTRLMHDFMTDFTKHWYAYVSKGHHKDRDCHFYVKKVWSYGEKPCYEASHFGYIGDEFTARQDNYFMVLVEMISNIIKMLDREKKWVDSVLSDPESYDDDQIAMANYFNENMTQLLDILPTPTPSVGGEI